MRIELFLNGSKMIEKGIDIPDRKVINALPFKDRVNYMEELVRGNAMDMKGRYFKAIDKAKSYEIYVVF